MKGRPRLVEEGIPITQSSYTSSSTEDRMFDNTTDSKCDASSSYLTQQQQQQQPAKPVYSSLQSALSDCQIRSTPLYSSSSNNYNNKPPITGATSYQIGSNTGISHVTPAEQTHASTWNNESSHHYGSSSWTSPSQSHPMQDQQQHHFMPPPNHHHAIHGHAQPSTNSHESGCIPNHFQVGHSSLPPSTTPHYNVHHQQHNQQQQQQPHYAVQSHDIAAHQEMDHEMSTDNSFHHSVQSHTNGPLDAATHSMIAHTNNTPQGYHYIDHHSAPSAQYESTTTTAQTVSTAHVIGGQNNNYHDDTYYEDDPVERMEGVEDHSIKPPLIVLDGANVAYAYATAKLDGPNVSSLHHERMSAKIQPNTKGIQVATEYFQSAGFRVLVVLPMSWMRSKPRPGDLNRNNASMETPQLELLQNLRNQGLLVASPPTDDDDAYALTIARREVQRAQRRPQTENSSGYVLSNDLFRDAISRDATHELRNWLTKGHPQGNQNDGGPGRISYAFCDMGSTDDYGDSILDFVPNPRHPLVAYVEKLPI